MSMKQSNLDQSLALSEVDGEIMSPIDVVTAHSIVGTKPLTSGMQSASSHSVPWGQSAGSIAGGGGASAGGWVGGCCGGGGFRH